MVEVDIGITVQNSYSCTVTMYQIRNLSLLLMRTQHSAVNILQTESCSYHLFTSIAVPDLLIQFREYIERLSSEVSVFPPTKSFLRITSIQTEVLTELALFEPKD